MNFLNFFRPIEGLTEYKRVVAAIEQGKQIIELNGISETEKALITVALHHRFGKCCFLITHDDLAAKKITEDVRFFAPDLGQVLPARDTIFHKIDARSSELRQGRMKCIQSMLYEEAPIIITTAAALFNKLISPQDFKQAFREINMGDCIDLNQLIDHLIYAGYGRENLVEGKGQFSIRGGIIDIFPPTEENPVRIELFDEEVDSMRFFDALTQRSMEHIQSVSIAPMRELLLRPEDYTRAYEQIQEELHKKTKKSEVMAQYLSQDMERMKEQQCFEGIEKYTTYMTPKAYSIMDYMGDCIVIVDEVARVREHAVQYHANFTEQFKDLLAEEKVLPQQVHTIFDVEQVLELIKSKQILTMNTMLKSNEAFRPQEIIPFTTRTMQPFHGKIEMLLEEIAELKRKQYRVIILSGNGDRGKRIAYALQEKNIDAVYRGTLDFELKSGHVVVLPGTLNGSFEFPQIQYAVISDREFFANQSPRKVKKKGNVIKNFSELKVGDFVVHESHGVGKYIGIEKITVDHVMRDYLYIQYQGSDKLFIPTDQLDLIQKYIGNADKDPKLNKLGGTDWAKAKAKARQSIDDIAGELIQLYAKRQEAIGFPFSADKGWQKEFEDFFPYEATADQNTCIEEIKADMESPRVMDRLLCGDVGYGKTEVALRAAFKAIMDGKQVAILVPTTILAQQHFNTAKSRFSQFPVNVEMLSRFKSASQQKEVVKSLKEGTVDLVIGTHKLLNEEIKYKDLGLLIIDEEQRFGVKHKEKIKQIANNIDVLTLSATPIPRTLHMSMTGIRDISVINEPPAERHPVQTYVMEYNEDLIRDALIREISRGGQVYYLYNRVSSIAKVAGKLRAIVPDARIAVAHGQMGEHTLEETMLDFYNHEYDILVCTTIIETGLDIPNVNTILIHDADRLGLSQLYQLRGRVGRSNRLAHAYLMYQRDKVLNQEAEKRLRAIKEFTEFGSGFKIAMRDLEIRGAGDILGSSQSGHMESIGYDLYIRLLEEKLNELKGEVKAPKNDTVIEISINAHIPDQYIADNEQKIEIYKKIVAIENEQDYLDITDELIDRFGDIPDSVISLIHISFIRAMARLNGINHIAQKGNNIVIKFINWQYSSPKMIADLVGIYKSSLLFSATQPPYITYKLEKMRGEKVLEKIKVLLSKINTWNSNENSV